MKRLSCALALIAALSVSACGNASYRAQTSPTPTANTVEASATTTAAEPSPSETTPPAVESGSPSVMPSPTHVPAVDPSPCAGPPFIDPAARDGGTPAPSPFHRETLPVGFRPVLLITCTNEERTTPTDGQWTYVVELDATEGLDDVVTALRATPPPPPTGNIMCAMNLVSDPFLLLVDASGRVVLPDVPHEQACHKPMDIGLGKLHFTKVHAFKVRQQRTPAQLATSCFGQWKNEPRISVDMSNSQDSATPVGLPARPSVVCVYGPGKDPEVGEFSGGRKLTDAESSRLQSLGRAPAGASASCKPADRFALIMMDQQWAYVELSGCERLVVKEGSLYGGPVPALAAAIRALDLVH